MLNGLIVGYLTNRYQLQILCSFESYEVMTRHGVLERNGKETVLVCSGYCTGIHLVGL